MDLLANKTFMAGMSALILAQLLKGSLDWIVERKFELKRFTGSGGMPSSHSAAVSAIATSMGFVKGIDSPEFSICFLFGLIVIFDATGIRRAAGHHAEILNKLVRDLSYLIEEGYNPKTLKTLLGHTYPQVAMGIFLGVLIGYFWANSGLI